MRPLRIVMARLRSLLRGRALDRDLNDELNAHLEEAAEEYERQGLSREDARRAAQRSFGGVLLTKDAHHDLRSFGWIEDARNDARYAVRALAKSAAFASVAIATMALAIGAATALFSVIDAALLRPIPYPRPEEIFFVNVGASFEERTAPSVADVERWRSDTNAFTTIGIGTVDQSFLPVVVDAGVPERLAVGEASEDFLELFGVTPVLGRGITIDDRRSGAPLVVLIAYRYWQERFNASPDVIGRSIRLDGELATIVGVLPESFYPEGPLWRPYRVTAAEHARRGLGMPVYGRLRPGVAAEAATRELSAYVAAGDGNPDLRVWLTSLYDATTRGYGRTIGVLSGAVVLIVLIACVNVAGLLFARGAVRGPELAIRTSIGASRGRLVRQLLVESAVLATLGGMAGLVLAWMMLDVIVGLIPLRMPDNVSAILNLQVLAFAFALTVLTAFGFGLAPAFTSSRANARTFIAAGRVRQGAALTRRGGQALVAVEVAMAVVLVMGAALMIRSFSKMLAIDVGFEPRAMYTMEVVPVETEVAVLRGYYSALLENVRQIPGVLIAGGADRPPLDGSGSYSGATVNGTRTSVAMRRVTPGYFETIGMRLLQGRFPSVGDEIAFPAFAVLSDSAARALFPDQSPLGQQFTLVRNTWTVVAVVADALNRTLLPDGRPVRPDVYLAYQPGPASAWGPGMTIVVRPKGRVQELAQELRRTALEMGRPVIVGPVRSGRDWLQDRVVRPRQQTLMLSALGGLGLALTLIGIFATTAYAVARRTHEVGVRMALGARPGQMVLAIVRDTAWPVALGIVLGLAGAVAATRVIASFLFETTPTDPLTLAVTVIALAITALVAAWIPARRAAHVDPVAALRAE